MSGFDSLTTGAGASEALQRAGSEFRARLQLVTPRDWDRRTPCDEWTVRALVNHVVGGNHRYAMILRDEPADIVLRTHGLDALGDDPAGAFESGFQAVVDTFNAPNMLTKTVHHPKSGPMTGAQLRVLRVSELTVHSWDLARAIRVDDRFDRELAAWLYTRLQPIQGTITASGMYKPSTPPTAASTDPQGFLLRLLGRQPD